MQTHCQAGSLGRESVPPEKRFPIRKVNRSGCIYQRDGNWLTLRTRVLAGLLTADQLSELAKIAVEYGRGVVQLTSRMGVEIPWIREGNIEAICTRLASVNLPVGGTGPTVRAIVACKGSTCKNGLIDTQQLCRELDARLFGKRLPAKFKIRIAGCPNDCSQARTNDLDFIGQCAPRFKDSCSLCGSCIDACPGKALGREAGCIAVNRSLCVGCGKCASICPEEAISPVGQGVAVFIGGKFGREYRIGRRFGGIIPAKKVSEVAERLVDFYRENALPKERFGDTIARIGVDNIRLPV